jgi:hypothetical protein
VELVHAGRGGPGGELVLVEARNMCVGKLLQLVVQDRGDDSSLTPVSEHEDICAAVTAGKHRVEVEDLDFGYALFADGCRVASFAEGRIRYREWARRNGAAKRHSQHRRPL